jgi:hypothetical protein
MDHLHGNYIYGYYGCDSKIGLRILAGTEILKPVKKRGDLFGPAISFCEDPYWALRCATNGANKTYIKNPMVIGALIDLGLCLYLKPPFPYKVGKKDQLVLGKLLGAIKGHRDNKMCPTTSFDTIRCFSCYGKSFFNRVSLPSRHSNHIRVINPEQIKAYFQL